MRKDGER
jgi:hypothetical protein